VQSEVNGIVDVLSQITSIADQTNLLALNAAIEAARAGETGRGFAVVADEVRNLAMRTQESTVQIQEGTERLNKTVCSAVESMSSATVGASDGINLVSQVGEKIQELDKAVSGLVGVNESVAAAAEEQKYTAASITDNVEVLSRSSTELSESANEVSVATTELARIATELSDNVTRFKT
jgi:methyl-accepting chemotaxis protein